MKKMNNKGFAISTLLYGLLLVAFLVVALLMSIMSTNRKNTSTLIKKIEEELNRYSQTTTEITTTGSAQEFIVPYGKAGWYKIELWGAAANTTTKLGSYTSGVIYLEENKHIYFHIGTTGTSTDVRLLGGEKVDSAGINSRIMYANGGNESGNSYIKGHSYNSPHSSTGNYGFINTLIQEDVNKGAGKATIELVSTNSKDNPPAKKNNNLNGVRYIRDCVTGTSPMPNQERWKEIQAFDSSGTNVAANKIARYNDGSIISNLTDSELNHVSGIKSASANTVHCVTLDLGASYDLEEIVIYHNFADGEKNKYKSETISVLDYRQIRYTEIKSWNTSNHAPFETIEIGEATGEKINEGIRVSARNPEIITSIPSGNYYLQPASSLKTAISASGTTAIYTLNNGQPSQRWAITAIDGTYYKIIEASKELALQPSEGAIKSGETVGTNDKYGDHAWEMWQIIPIGNGYYQLKSKANATLCIGTYSDNRDEQRTLIMRTCRQSESHQWFKLINADY